MRANTGLELFIITKKRQMEKYAKHPNFHSFRILNDKLVLAFLKKRVCMLNQSPYIAFSVLDFAKERMYDSLYNTFKKKWNSMQICMTDTDSFLAVVNTKDLIKDLQDLKEHFDFSNFPPE